MPNGRGARGKSHVLTFCCYAEKWNFLFASYYFLLAHEQHKGFKKIVYTDAFIIFSCSMFLLKSRERKGKKTYCAVFNPLNYFSQGYNDSFSFAHEDLRGLEVPKQKFENLYVSLCD